ncbi:MAG: AmmeMemoRadiSam system protein B [Dehalococcoidia bacterium]|nr:AmmeMemoRadiSam system protein B [Dehalococcoidia bacterium]
MPDQVNPKLRAVNIQPAMHRGQQGVLLADPLGIKESSLFVPAALAPLLPLIDGSRDLGTLRTGFELRTGIPLIPQVVENLISELDASCLLDNAHFAQALRSATDEYRRAKSRPPIMAGRSCPGDPQELARLLQGHLDAAQSRRVQGEVPAGGLGVSPNSLPLPPRVGDRGLKLRHEIPSDGVADMPPWAAKVKGIISPHIDFPRGGPIYGEVWATAAVSVKEADLIVILGTDHNGGEGGITLTRQSYETPWGVLPTDQDVVDRIATSAGEDAVFAGELRHRSEHSVEAAVIWAHYLRRDKPCRMVPILCGSFEPFIRQNVGPSTSGAISATTEVLSETAGRRRTIIVAAADLAHVGPAFGDLLPLDLAARARLEAQDRRLLEILAKADPRAFLEEIATDGDQRRICGIPPIYITLAVLAGMEGTSAGYAQCPASDDGTSMVSICGMVYH